VLGALFLRFMIANPAAIAPMTKPMIGSFFTACLLGRFADILQQTGRTKDKAQRTEDKEHENRVKGRLSDVVAGSPKESRGNFGSVEAILLRRGIASSHCGLPRNDMGDQTE
jgi:hypothetical protein